MGRLSLHEGLGGLERADLDAEMACQRDRSRAHTALKTLVRISAGRESEFTRG